MKRSPVARATTTGRSAEVAALRAAVQAVLEDRSFAETAGAVLGACKTIVGSESGLVGVRDGTAGEVEVVFVDAGPVEIATGKLPARLRPASARAVNGRAIIANSLPSNGKSGAARGAAIRSALLAPIMLDGERAGLLGLINKPGGFSAGDTELAELFAEMLAMAMLGSRMRHGFDAKRSALEDQVREAVTELRRAYESEQRARHVADALREATVALTRSLDRGTVLTTLLDRVRQMVPCDRAKVMLVDEAARLSVRAVFDGERVEPQASDARAGLDPARHPVLREILQSGTAVMIPDVRSQPEWSLPPDGTPDASWMGVPLFARGDVAGLFTLSRREPGSFSDEHVRLAEAMASQASVAVENAVLFEQMQASSARMQSLSRRLVDAQESERRSISRELHDEAGQALASLRFGLRLLERDIGDGKIVTERVTELVQQTDAVIDGLHRLAVDLRPVSLDHLGLEAALRQYTRSAGAKFGIAVRFKARGFKSERLPPAVETALYRVVQEAMTNVVRHARATRVDVILERRDGRAVVIVEDDGVGFAPEVEGRGDHFGLLGMRERAEALGGTLTLESSPGAGTTVVVEVDIADPDPDR